MTTIQCVDVSTNPHIVTDPGDSFASFVGFYVSMRKEQFPSAKVVQGIHFDAGKFALCVKEVGQGGWAVYIYGTTTAAFIYLVYFVLRRDERYGGSSQVKRVKNYGPSS